MLTETNHTFFNENITDDGKTQLFENYFTNFQYTKNHISTYNSNNFTIAIYKMLKLLRIYHKEYQN